MSEQNEITESAYTEFPKVILLTFTMIGIITKLILSLFVSTNDGSFGSANTAIWGNLIIIFSLISYLSIDHYLQNHILYPLALLVMMLLWDTTISYTYFERINKAQVPSIYNTWSTFSNLMTLCFIFILMYSLFNQSKEQSKMDGFLYIIGFFSLFITGIQQTILDNYMVDTDVTNAK